MTDTATAAATLRAAKPATKPDRPYFSSGRAPSRRAGRRNRSTFRRSAARIGERIGKAKLAEAIERTHALLRLPADYQARHRPRLRHRRDGDGYLVAARPRPVTMLAWESFGAGWVTDVAKQLKLDAEIRTADYGEICDLDRIDPASDVVFTWNGTTSGVRVPNARLDRGRPYGLQICDATSAAFAQDIDWAKIDVGTFSWQKALGGEAAHGMLVLSPRAVERLEREPAPRPLPKIFRLTKGGKLIEGIFKGETINTPSMLCVEDWLFALDWAERIGGLDALIARADANAAALDRWVQGAEWIEHLAADPAIRSNTSVACNSPIDRTRRRTGLGRRLCQLLEAKTPLTISAPIAMRRRACALVRRNSRYGRHRGARALARLGLGGHTWPNQSKSSSPTRWTRERRRSSASAASPLTRSPA